MPSGKDRRRFKRYKHKGGFRLSVGGKSFNAKIYDFSLGGIGFFVEDAPLLTEGSIVDLKIEDLNLDIEGMVVWAAQVNSHLKVGVERKIISGLLKHYPLPDILLDLQRSEKDGILEIKYGSISKRIYIKNGDMVFATSNKEEDRMGEILLRAGKISVDQHYQSVDIMKKNREASGYCSC